MRRTLTLAAMFVLATSTSAQTVLIRTGENGIAKTQTLPEGAILEEMHRPDGTVATRLIDPSAEARLIVLFDAPALLEEGANKSAQSVLAAIDAQHTQFAGDIAAINARASKRGSARTEITHAYKRTLNGVAVVTQEGLRHEIASLPYVRRVFRDRKMKAVDGTSNRVIGADRAHRELGVSGRGVVVAVIDTGIDYTHPALGGGLGAGFKVIGGYDWVHDDADPFDDHGHGTHVAGIIAGNDGGDFVGVAPQATLIAYKVLDASGFGDTADVVAAIERAVDPDGDPATNDAVDVMNLSLGGSGDPDDPASLAIDNATAAGVVAVVAAGNDGRAFSIGSPGTARTAITVGASDNDDHIANFSSRGPVSLTFANKPDVLAPGVAINSTVPGNEYVPLNGTSMATPHVAGAAALLLERHPSWDPATVKSALMLSARSTGLGIWEQGAGRIDILAADALTTVISPANISFGNLDPMSSSVQLEQVLTIRNFSSAGRTYSLTSSHALQGTTIQISPSSVTIGAGESRTVTVIATFQPASLNFSEELHRPFLGEIRIASGAESSTIPFSVTKTPQLVLRYDQAPDEISVFNDDGWVEGVVLPSGQVSFPLRRGMYDIVSKYNYPIGDFFVRGYQVREAVSVQGKVELDLLMSEMQHTVTFQGVDRDGAPLKLDNGAIRFWHRSGFVGSMYGVQDARVQVSTVGSGISFEGVFYNMSHPSGEDYVVQMGAATGISESITVRNDPAALRKVRTSFKVPSTVRELYVVQQMYQIEPMFWSITGYYDLEQAEHHRLTAPFERIVNYAPTPYPGFAFRLHGSQAFNTTNKPEPQTGEESNLLFTSPTLELLSDRTRVFAFEEVDSPLRTVAGDVFEDRIGFGMLAWTARMRNGGSLVRLDRRRTSLFLGGSGEIIDGPVTVRLESRDSVEGGILGNDLSSKAHPLTFQSGPVEGTFTLESGFVDDWPIKAAAKVSFDTQAAGGGVYDPNPPFIHSLTLKQNGAEVEALESGADGSVVAVVRDETGGEDDLRAVSFATLDVRRLGDDQWKSLSVVRNGDEFSGHMSGDAAPGYYDLRLMARDQAGNTLEYVADPSFRFGSIEGNHVPGRAVLAYPPSGFEVDMDSVAAPLTFVWEASSDPDEGQVLGYVLRIKGTGLDTTFSTRGTSVAVAIAGMLQQGFAYTWSVETTDGFSVVESEAAALYTTAPGVSVEDGNVPREFALLPNYPNPFNPTTNIRFTLPQQSKVRLVVFDILGRRVADLIDDTVSAGDHVFAWEASHLSSGVYFVRLEAGAFSQMRQVALSK